MTTIEPTTESVDSDDYNDPTPEQAAEWLGSFVPAVMPFVLRRTEDVTGVSGTGIVADGVIFPGGTKTVTRWRGGTTGVAQTCVWDSISDVNTVHGHNGATQIDIVPMGAVIEALTAALAVKETATDTGNQADDDAARGWNEAVWHVQDEITRALSFSWNTYGPGAEGGVR